MERIVEFVKFGQSFKAVTKIDTTFNVWVTEVRRLQKENEYRQLEDCSMIMLHKYYNNAHLPKEVIEILTPGAKAKQTA